MSTSRKKKDVVSEQKGEVWWNCRVFGAIKKLGGNFNTDQQYIGNGLKNTKAEQIQQFGVTRGFRQRKTKFESRGAPGLQRKKSPEKTNKDWPHHP